MAEFREKDMVKVAALHAQSQDEIVRLKDELAKLELKNDKLITANVKLKAENDDLNELAAHYRERYQSLVNKLVAKVDEVGRG